MNMINWIKKNIDPPGIEKKNRGSLFSAIGRIFEIVQRDAEKAFKAHFPYLADPQTLRKHGESLNIPELPYDSEADYRERVATASFYLSKAGERKYILDQLETRFGSRFLIRDEFLKVYLEISELNSIDRTWVFEFLDNILDPNIYLSIAEIFNYIETVIITDGLLISVIKNTKEYFINPLKYNGMIKYDGKTVNKKMKVRAKYDGRFKYNGDAKYNGTGKVDVEHEPIPPFKYRSGTVDVLDFTMPVNGEVDNLEMLENVSVGIRRHQKYNGEYKYNGAIKYNGMKLIPLG